MMKPLTMTAALAALVITALGALAQPGAEGRRNEAGSNEAGQARKAEPGRGQRNVRSQESRPSGAQNERGRQESRRAQSQGETAGRGRIEKQVDRSSRDTGRNVSKQSRETGKVVRERSAGDRTRERQDATRTRTGERTSTVKDRPDAARTRVGERGTAVREREVQDRNRDRKDTNRTRVEQRSTVGRSETTGREREGRGSLAVSGEQRTRITTRFSENIRRMNVRPLPRSSFSVSVGASVPRSIRLYTVPADVIAIYPQYRSYRFVLVEDEIVIVDPGSYSVVTVLPISGRGYASRSSNEFVVDGRPYCFYFDGWNGAGWYRCGFAQRRGLGWGGVYGWHNWVYAPAERRFGAVTRERDGREGSRTRTGVNIREGDRVREGSRDRGPNRDRVGQGDRGRAVQDNRPPRTEGRGGEKESNRRGTGPSQRGGQSGDRGRRDGASGDSPR
jgi:hypothetical protein